MTEVTDNPAAHPVKTSEPFVVMIKPVGSLCNLRCDYCYYRETSYDSPGAARLTDGLLETFIRQYMEASPGPVVSFTWHGGEPSLAGLDFFALVVELQKRYLPEGWNCWNSLQTNGLLLDDRWCSFLAENHFDVGLSIDGAKWIHDQYRKDSQGRGSYQSAFDAVKRLQSFGVQPDLLCTVTRESALEPLAVYRSLRSLDTGWIQFIPIVRPITDSAASETSAGLTATPDSVTGEGYGKFLCAVFDEWVLHDLGRLDVQLFAETMRVWSGGKAGLCWMSPVCGRALILEKDGGVYSCDHFVNQAHRIGGIDSSHLGTLVDLPFQRRFGEDKRDKLSAECRSCQWLSVCNGGCPKDRFILSKDGESGQNYLCAGLKHFFSYMEPAAKLISLLAKKGLSPEAIMNQLRAMIQSKWKDIKRNDPCPCGSGRKAKNCCWSKWKH